MSKKVIKLIIILIIIVLMSFIITYLLYHFNIIKHKEYTNADFNIATYISKFDKDNDGIDDQTDILRSVRDYISTKPKYKSKYYNSGYPDDEYGVCTDVVAFGLKGAGYDLMQLVNEDVENNKDRYQIDKIDENIDFRRTKNLQVYFENNSINLTVDTKDIKQWQGGDIVIYDGHIAVVSDKRNQKGIPFIIHHAYSGQLNYEEDALESFGKILGHYRIS